MIPALPQLTRWGLLIASTVLIGAGLSYLHLPGAWLIGAVFAGIGFALTQQNLSVRKPFFYAAQAIIGCTISTTIDPQMFLQSPATFGWALVSSVSTICAGFFVALTVSRMSVIDRRDALWGFMPAVAGAMIAMSEGKANDSRIVAVIQILRLMVVLGALTMISAALSAGTLEALPKPEPHFPYGLILVAGIVVLTPYVTIFPAFPFIVPLLIGIALKGVGLDMTLPTVVIVLAFVTIGWHVGLRFTPQVIRLAGAALPAILIGSGMLLTCGLMMAGVLIFVAQKDPMTAFLATVPGSIDSLAVIAMQTHADLNFVMPLQIARMFAVLMVSPFLSRMS